MTSIVDLGKPLAGVSTVIGGRYSIDIVHDDAVDEITEREREAVNDANEVEDENEEKSAIAVVDSLVLNACQPAQQDGWGHCIGASKIKDTQNTDISALPSSHRQNTTETLPSLSLPLPSSFPARFRLVSLSVALS